MKLLNLAASGFLLFGASCAGAAGFKAENVDMPLFGLFSIEGC